MKVEDEHLFRQGYSGKKVKLTQRVHFSVTVAIAVALLLVVLTFLTLRAIHAEHARHIATHTLTALDAMTRMVELWERDHMRGATAMVEHPRLIELVSEVIDASGDAHKKGEALEAWLEPIYSSRGYHGHSVITPAGLIVAASSPAFVGQKVESPAALHVISRATREGAAMSRPIGARFNVGKRDARQPVGTLFQLACASIVREAKSIGVLCLRLDPNTSFFEILRSGQFAKTGEAYAVDRSGKLISPSRFQADLLEKRLIEEPKVGLPPIWARVPEMTASDKLLRLAASDAQPLTAAVQAAIDVGKAGYQEGYRDYRGTSVVGAARWLPSMDIGLVVEQDVEEAYAPYSYSLNAIVSLAGAAIVLIVVLTTMSSKSRRHIAASERRFRS
ncbi:MAG TPA: hypothetical protein VM532_02835, partial [Burkholderiales bacterium]|nr:hypothetical protein [Burkholderiales bacterium]